ncbi:MAG TPA: Nramp family divalent metal transporter [Gemmatimonadota bacterium]|nr:Nramp family divalent metal transporter [Gemmatimonadota bacterium]
MVAAAFLGPGTITTATLAGVRTGSALLWALLFSVLATLALQEMAARLGLVTGQGLGEAVRARFRRGPARTAAALLVLSAIVIGNAAYETGNLLGGALGASALGGGPARAWAPVLGLGAAALLWWGRYAILQRWLTLMVGVMGIVFFATAATLLPSPGELLRGLLVPEAPGSAALLALGLVGTTVVPYNLFLHASAVRERWSGAGDLPEARRDAARAIVLGGLVSMAVVVTAAGAGAPGVENAADMARQLEPLLGEWARVFFGAGLLAAGLTSAITAPLAAAWAACGVLGWDADLRSARFRAVWGLVLGAGIAFSVLGIRPVPAILFAQVANGLLLPAVAVFLLVAVNDGERMGRWRNGRALNLAGAVVVALAAVLGVRALAGVF